jgi:hypothetical protein
VHNCNECCQLGAHLVPASATAWAIIVQVTTNYGTLNLQMQHSPSGLVVSVLVTSFNSPVSTTGLQHAVQGLCRMLLHQ